ncbi:MAG: DUF6036 family nucleotidyltransferase [Verrucomicrobiales bacterium]
MKRADLEHIIRASAAITGAEDIVIIGSQAILGPFPEAPKELLISHKADVFTFRDPHDSLLIDGSIGEGSPFHHTFGYYAHGVGEETAALQTGWKERLVIVRNGNTGGGRGLCLDANDLAVAKLAAGREKDLNFVSQMAQHQLIDSKIVEERSATLPMPHKDLALQRLQRILKSK